MKLENLLINENLDIKICDFGMAFQDNGSFSSPGFKKNKDIYSLNCLAPEALNNTSSNSPFGSLDIWGLGCILYFLIFGYYPFQQFEVINKLLILV